MEDITTLPPVTEVPFVYAGFWRRLVAAILDYIMLAVILRIISAIFLFENMFHTKEWFFNTKLVIDPAHSPLNLHDLWNSILKDVTIGDFMVMAMLLTLVNFI